MEIPDRRRSYPAAFISPRRREPKNSPRHRKGAKVAKSKREGDIAQLRRNASFIARKLARLRRELRDQSPYIREVVGEDRKSTRLNSSHSS